MPNYKHYISLSRHHSYAIENMRYNMQNVKHEQAGWQSGCKTWVGLSEWAGWQSGCKTWVALSEWAGWQSGCKTWVSLLEWADWQSGCKHGWASQGGLNGRVDVKHG